MEGREKGERSGLQRERQKEREESRRKRKEEREGIEVVLQSAGWPSALCFC